MLVPNKAQSNHLRDTGSRLQATVSTGSLAPLILSHGDSNDSFHTEKATCTDFAIIANMEVQRDVELMTVQQGIPR